MTTKISKAARKELVKITNPALRRIQYRADVITSAKESFDTMRELIVKFLTPLVRGAVYTTAHNRLVTVEPHIARSVAAYNGVDVVGAVGKLRTRGAKGKAAAQQATGTRHKTGQVAKREARKEQRATYLAFPYNTFRRLIKAIGNQYSDDNLRYSRDTIFIFQVATEEYLIQILRGAREIFLAASGKNSTRKRVFTKHINIAARIYGPTSIVAPIAVLKTEKGRMVTLDTYIRKVLKSIHDDSSITDTAEETVHNLLVSLIGRLMIIVNDLVLSIGKVTVAPIDIKTAVASLFPEQLYSSAIDAGDAALEKFKEAPAPARKKGDNKAVRRARGARAGLVFAVSRIEDYMIMYSQVERKSGGTGVYLTAVIENVANLILEAASEIAEDKKKTRITPYHLLLAIRGDPGLNRLFPERTNVIAPGVAPELEDE